MKIVVWILCSVVAVIIAFGVVERLASERIEVVELHTQDETGSGLITRLWIVDFDGHAYLRSGDDASGWYARLLANPAITVTRDSELQSYKALPQPDLRSDINKLMQEKYTWGDSFIGFVFGRDDSIPVKLVQL